MTDADPPRSTPPGPIAILAEPSEDVSASEAVGAASAHYGLAARAEPLRSERDRNFLLNAADGGRWVLKLGHPAESEAEAQLGTRALRHVASVDPGLPVPRMVPTTAGEDCFRWTGAGGETRIGRMTSFVAGVPMAGRPRTTLQLERFGAMAARLGLALRSFSDPAAGRALPWDLARVGEVASLLRWLPDEGDRRRAGAAIERARTVALQRLVGLRTQIIHNDLNPSNVLVDADHPDRPCGIIDFGDLLSGALVCDVAIAAAYLAAPGGDPLADLVRFVAAYGRTAPLTREEVDLLPDLIAARQAMSLAIGAWRARRDSGNAAYLLRNRGAASIGLEAIDNVGPAAVARRLREACGMVESGSG